MMKQLFRMAFAAMLLAGCKGTQYTTGTDDVYASPAEEREAARVAAEARARRQAQEEKALREEEQKRQDELAEEQRRQENNPYYKDPSYSSEDYYDYAYAARINRFHRPVYGAGFYDPYYTNMYTYNQNPAFWGTSIYSFNMGMPSAQFGFYSLGLSTGWGYGGGWNNCFDPWGYYDPFCRYGGLNSGWGYGYNSWSYMNGYYNGFYNGYYNGWNNAGWGYYNMMDPNSGYGQTHYGPRGSNGGSNSDRRAGAGAVMEESSGRRQYIQNVAARQENSPRFSAPPASERRNASQGRIMNNPGNTVEDGPRDNAREVQRNGEQPARRGGRREASEGRINQQPRQETPREQPREQQRIQQPRNEQWTPAPPRQNTSNPGGSSPRGGSGGNSRPRR